MTMKAPQPVIRRELTTPRAAAFAGFGFSILLGITSILVNISFPAISYHDAAWLSEFHARNLSIVTALVPFAGISFLWFMGVIREQIGVYEDKFFATIFLGSGLLFLGGLFVWIALMDAVLISFTVAPESWGDSNAYILGLAMIQVTANVLTLRMAGVFMFSTGTIWLRTKIMPRWFVWFTYILANVLLFVAPTVRWVILAFPFWVLLASIMLIRPNRSTAFDMSSYNAGNSHTGAAE